MKIYDVLSLLHFWWGQKTYSLHEILTRLVIPETKGAGDLKHHKFSFFDGTQHPKKNLVPWMLKSPLTSVLNKK